MGRILAIDYGQKRTGLAVSDPLRIIANALDTVPTGQLLNYLTTYIAQEQVDVIVIGLPITLQGESTTVTPHIQGLVRKLSQLYPHIKVNTFDERFTSKLASQAILQSGISKKARQNKALIDKVAATIILENYMEAIR